MSNETDSVISQTVTSVGGGAMSPSRAILNTFYGEITPLVERIQFLVALSEGTLLGPVPSDIDGADILVKAFERADSEEPKASEIRKTFYSYLEQAQEQLGQLADSAEKTSVMNQIGRLGDVSNATDPTEMSVAANFEQLTGKLNDLRAAIVYTLNEVRVGRSVEGWSKVSDA